MGIWLKGLAVLVVVTMLAACVQWITASPAEAHGRIGNDNGSE